MSTPAALVNHHDEIAVQTKTPLQKMRESFPLAYQKRNGWWTNDDNPRFDFLESPEGNIRLNPWTGRSWEATLAMGNPPLRMVDLYAKPGTWSAVQSRDKLCLLDLAQYMKIHHGWLTAHGFSDEYVYTYPNGSQVRCVKMGGYCTPDGKEHSKHQVRVSLHGKSRFYFDQNTPGEIIPCGLHYLDRARAAGYLFIGEGVSDWATMTFHDLPFIGIPGANHVKCLDVALLADIPAIYIIEEPDQVEKLSKTGQGFYAGLRRHLRENGYTGAIFSIRFMEITGFKDPSDLHKAIYQECSEEAEGPFREAVHARFIAEIEAAKERAIPEGNEKAPASHPASISFEDWFMQLMSCPRDILPWPHLCILAFLFKVFRDQQRDEIGWLIEPDALALKVGLGCEKDPGRTFRRILNEIQKKLGVLIVDPRSKKEYLDNGDVRHKGWSYYIRPRLSYYQPRGYVALTQDLRQQGGERPKNEQPPVDTGEPTGPLPCEWCGNVHTTPYAAWCEPCQHVTYPPIEEDEQDEPRTVEASAFPLPLESEELPQAPVPDIRKLRTSDKEETDSHTQIAYVGPQIDDPPSSSLQDEYTQQPPAESDEAPSYPPPRSYPLCHFQEQAEWRWNPRNNDGGGGWECAICHPPVIEAQPIPKPRPKPVSWLTLPIAAVLP